ncbi:MAG: hypothetical protein LRY66_04580 [Saccharospirillaceae bacterium]|nr:hypothetical protein [Saccharospirillaceae bacterium]
MFKQPLQHWAEAPPVSLPALADNAWDSLIQQAMAQSGQAASGFTLHVQNVRAPLSWSDSADPHLLEHEVRTYATLDEQGRLLLEQHPFVHVADLIDELHRTAGIPGVVGHESLGVLVMGGDFGSVFSGAGVRVYLPAADHGPQFSGLARRQRAIPLVARHP